MEKTMGFRLMALSVLAVFYGIYFAKMLSQKRRGIRTNQIGSRKEKGLHTVEQLMGAATVLVVVGQLISVFLDWNWAPDWLRCAGFGIGMAGNLIFFLSVHCMKDSWRAGIPEKDKTALVTGGIYRFSRNPAFLGFDLQYLGVLLLFFNPLNAIFSLFAVTMLHFQILQEEKFLVSAFGKEYRDYQSRVPRYFGLGKQK